MTLVITKPTPGGDNNAWGDQLNDALDDIVSAINDLSVSAGVSIPVGAAQLYTFTEDDKTSDDSMWLGKYVKFLDPFIAAVDGVSVLLSTPVPDGIDFDTTFLDSQVYVFIYDVTESGPAFDTAIADDNFGQPLQVAPGTRTGDFLKFQFGDTYQVILTALDTNTPVDLAGVYNSIASYTGDITPPPIPAYPEADNFSSTYQVFEISGVGYRLRPIFIGSVVEVSGDNQSIVVDNTFSAFPTVGFNYSGNLIFQDDTGLHLGIGPGVRDITSDPDSNLTDLIMVSRDGKIGLYDLNNNAHIFPVSAITAGNGISVDSTDPQSPVVNVELVSPGGTHYHLHVADDGTLSTTAV